jgi:hypothetical protein
MCHQAKSGSPSSNSPAGASAMQGWLSICLCIFTVVAPWCWSSLPPAPSTLAHAWVPCSRVGLALWAATLAHAIVFTCATAEVLGGSFLLAKIPDKAQGQRHQRHRHHQPAARVHAVRPGHERERLRQRRQKHDHDVHLEQQGVTARAARSKRGADGPAPPPPWQGRKGQTGYPPCPPCRQWSHRKVRRTFICVCVCVCVCV